MLSRGSKIFGVGLSRTGTLSLTAALTELGVETRHYPDDPLTQAELRAGSYELSVLNEVQALTDIAVAPYYRQLDRAFPGSRFILTTRETEAWLASVEKHFAMYVEHRRDAFDEFVLASVYGCVHFSAERFRDVKELHEANVRAYFADRPDDLLVLDVADADSMGAALPVSRPARPGRALPASKPGAEKAGPHADAPRPVAGAAAAINSLS